MKNRSDKNRLGITVSAKIGGAVIRNRVRRRIREIYRANETQLRSSQDIVIVARIRATKVDFKQLCDDFHKLACRLQLFREMDKPLQCENVSKAAIYNQAEIVAASTGKVYV